SGERLSPPFPQTPIPPLPKTFIHGASGGLGCAGVFRWENVSRFDEKNVPDRFPVRDVFLVFEKAVSQERVEALLLEVPKE
uniref:hypothetical protein n=1 Tax=uncultured Bilophila sp. TaxID=529385 RepID=UPI0025F1D118